jgi:hypothetical protein
MALALLMPLVVTMRHLLRQRMGERRFPTADPPRETCLRDRPYPAFRRGVAMRRPRRQWPTRHPGGGDVLLQDGAVLPLPVMQERLPHRQAPPRLHRAMAGNLHHPLDMRRGRYARDRELPAVSARHECTGLTDRSRGWVIHPRLPTSHPLVAEPSRHPHLEQVSPGGVSRAQGTHITGCKFSVVRSCSPRSSGKPTAAYERRTVRKKRDPPGRMENDNGRDRRLFCPSASDVPGSSVHWFSPCTSRG